MRLPSRLAKRTIRDCRMPTPQEANQQLREPATVASRNDDGAAGLRRRRHQYGQGRSVERIVAEREEYDVVVGVQALVGGGGDAIDGGAEFR
jgi:hypothetical protein